MTLVDIKHENGHRYIASLADVLNGCDVPLRFHDGRPRSINVKASSIVEFNVLPSEER